MTIPFIRNCVTGLIAKLKVSSIVEGRMMQTFSLEGETKMWNHTYNIEGVVNRIFNSAGAGNTSQHLQYNSICMKRLDKLSLYNDHDRKEFYLIQAYNHTIMTGIVQHRGNDILYFYYFYYFIYFYSVYMGIEYLSENGASGCIPVRNFVSKGLLPMT